MEAVEEGGMCISCLADRLELEMAEIRLSGLTEWPPFRECLIIPLTREGTRTPEAKEAILPEIDDSAFSLLPQPPFCTSLGLPRKRLCFCWLKLTKDEQD